MASALLIAASVSAISIAILLCRRAMEAASETEAAA